jgi:hypothetical protein
MSAVQQIESLEHFRNSCREPLDCHHQSLPHQSLLITTSLRKVVPVKKYHHW